MVNQYSYQNLIIKNFILDVQVLFLFVSFLSIIEISLLLMLWAFYYFYTFVYEN